MSSIAIDSIDRMLLNLLQIDFPLVKEPFRALAVAIGVDEVEVFHRIARLKEDKVVKGIGPIFNSGSLGYRSTLVGMRLTEGRLEQAARLINQYPGVSHNYARDYCFNLWFTLILPGNVSLEGELRKLDKLVEPEDVLNLPTLRIFKIKVYFDMMEQPPKKFSLNKQICHYVSPPSPSCVSPQDWAVISELQRDLPLTKKPFEAMAENLKMGEDEFLKQCYSLKERGIMRRFGALISHYDAGFTLNAMDSWLIPSSKVEMVGKKMAFFPEVRHCCERKTNSRWPYSLFTVVHARTDSSLEEIVHRLSRETDIREYVLLPTVKEFKNETVKYMPPNALPFSERSC